MLEDALQRIEQEEPKLKGAVKDLRALLAERRYYAAQKKLAKITAKYPNVNVWELTQRISSAIKKSDQLFLKAPEAHKTIWRREILTICSDYPPALDFLGMEPPTFKTGRLIVNPFKFLRGSKGRGEVFRRFRRIALLAIILSVLAAVIVVSALVRKNDALAKGFAELKLQFDSTTKDLASKVADFDDLSSRFDELQKTADATSTKLTSTEKDLAASRQEHDDLKREYDELKKSADATSTKLTSTEKELASKAAGLADLSSRFDELQKTADATSTRLASKEEELADARREYDDLKKDYDDLKKNADPTSTEKELADARREYDELKRIADSTSAKLASTEDELADARREYDELQKSSDSMKSEISEKDGRIQDLTSRNKSYEKQISDARDQNQTLNDEIESLREQIRKLKREFSGVTVDPSVPEVRREPSGTSRDGGEPLELTIKGEKAVFRLCPAGSFRMGSPSSEKDRDFGETQHEVTITKDYWLLETPVTQALWRAVMGNNPSYSEGDDLPVENISWFDCSNFVERLNTGGFAPKGMKFDFPTEAEWEYACRAGTTTPFNFGSSLNGDRANCNGSYPYGTTMNGAYIGETSPVKKYRANKWGLYDMHGNVSEWCKDWYGGYPLGSIKDPRGPSSGASRVLRGGNWYIGAGHCRSAYRHYFAPSYQNNDVGFRLALRSVD